MLKIFLNFNRFEKIQLEDELPIELQFDKFENIHSLSVSIYIYHNFYTRKTFY